MLLPTAHRNTYKDIDYSNFKYLVGNKLYCYQFLHNFSSHLCPPYTVIVDMMNRANIIKRIRNLEQQTDILRRIRKITNELKSNGAYSDNNIELEHTQLTKVGASDFELNVLAETWANKKKLCKRLWHELDELNKILNKEFDFDGTRNSN